MTSIPPSDVETLTAAEIVAATTSGRLRCTDVARAFLDRVGERDPDVRAFEHLDPDRVLTEAAALDRRGRRGPFHGVPFGVKDIIDVHDTPTEYGTPIFAGHRPSRDAACVALSRRAGGLYLGKTVTTEFANVSPVETCNPWDPTRTPGGSSSGSAAAVAAGMVPVALGTQTTGSTIRPASFCGVVGYRPTYGELSMSGVMEAASSLDTLGLFARSVDDVALYRDVLLGLSPHPLPQHPPPPRIGVARPYYSQRIEPVTRELLAGAVDRLTDAGAEVAESPLPDGLDGLDEAHRWISGFEMSRHLSWEIENHWDRISEGLREGRLRDGLNCTLDTYRRMQQRAVSARRGLSASFEGFDVLLVPATVGEATVGPDPVPHPWLYKMWSALHVPCITLPVLAGANGLPVGLQLVGRWGSDESLLAAAKWVTAQLGVTRPLP